MKQASIRTADEAGDGTTTSIVLTQALVNEAEKVMKEDPSLNPTSIRKAIEDSVEIVVDFLEGKAKPVTAETLIDVASISANNDPELGAIIAEAYDKVGVDGVVTIEESMGSQTYVDVVEGTRIKRGYHCLLYTSPSPRD